MLDALLSWLITGIQFFFLFMAIRLWSKAKRDYRAARTLMEKYNRRWGMLHRHAAETEEQTMARIIHEFYRPNEHSRN